MHETQEKFNKVLAQNLKEICQLEDLGVDGRTVNCSILRLRNDEYKVDSSGSGQGPVATLVNRN
jgi:hypothetical protein